MFDREVTANTDPWQIIRPDIVIEAKESNIILDTKWKELQFNLVMQNRRSIRKVYGIKPDDLYQTLVYGIHYQAHDIWLLYPENKNQPSDFPLIFESRNGENCNFRIHIFTLNLMNIEESLTELIDDIQKSITEN